MHDRFDLTWLNASVKPMSLSIIKYDITMLAERDTP